MGSTGSRVASNIQCLRRLRGYSYAELSRRLATHGHPILDTGILKIEKGARRVDVDDLMALAAALEADPAVLLMADVRRMPPAAWGSPPNGFTCGTTGS